MICILVPGFIDCDFTFPFPLTSTLKPIFLKLLLHLLLINQQHQVLHFLFLIVLSILSRLATDSELILISKGILLYIFFAIDLNTGAATVAP